MSARSAPARSGRAAGAATLGVALAGAAGVFATTRHGVGVTPDSVNYLRAARSLLAGEGFRVLQEFHFPDPVPMTHWPPLYPLVLSTFGAVGLDLETGARALGAGLLGVNALLAASLATRLSGTRTAGLLAAVITVTALPLFRLHALALTEPLFLCGVLLAIGWLHRFLETPRDRLLLAAATAAAAACLTRYQGAGLLLGGVASLIVLGSGPVGRRLRHAALFGAVAGGPAALWMLRNQFAEARSYGSLFFEPATVGLVADALGDEARLWLDPFPTGLARLWPAADALVAGMAALAGVALVATAIRRAARRQAGPEHGPASSRPGPPPGSGRLAGLLGLFVAAHLAFLTLTVAVLSPVWTVTPRLVTPAFAALAILVAGAAGIALRRIAPDRTGRFALTTLVGVLLTAQTARLATHAALLAERGLWYRGPRWRHSELIAWAKRLPGQVPLYSNYADPLYLHVRHHDLHFLPSRRNPRGDNPDFPAQMEHLRRALREEGGLVLWFDAVPRPYFPALEELRRALPAETVVDLSDGRVLAAPGHPLVAEPVTR